MALPSPSTTTGISPPDHGLASRDHGLASRVDGLPDMDDTGSNPIIDDKEVPEEGQHTLQASLDAGLPVNDHTCFNSPIDPKKVQEEVQDVVRASLDVSLHVDDDTRFNSIINDNEVLQEAQDAVQPQRNLATLPPTHLITPGSQLADHGPSTLQDALPVDEHAGFNWIVLHDKIDEDVRQGVVELALWKRNPRPSSTMTSMPYLLKRRTTPWILVFLTAPLFLHKLLVLIPYSTQISRTYFFFPRSLLNDSHYIVTVYFFSVELSC